MQFSRRQIDLVLDSPGNCDASSSGKRMAGQSDDDTLSDFHVFHVFFQPLEKTIPEISFEPLRNVFLNRETWIFVFAWFCQIYKVY